MARQFIVLADESKIVNYLGETFKLPIEVDKFNWLLISKKLKHIMISQSNEECMRIYHLLQIMGIIFLDCELKSKIDPYQLHEFLIHLTGVLETGYF